MTEWAVFVWIPRTTRTVLETVLRGLGPGLVQDPVPLPESITRNLARPVRPLSAAAAVAATTAAVLLVEQEQEPTERSGPGPGLIELPVEWQAWVPCSSFSLEGPLSAPNDERRAELRSIVLLPGVFFAGGLTGGVLSGAARRRRMRVRLLTAVALSFVACEADRPDAERPLFEEFCLRGEFDLGARLQGRRPSGGEWHPTEWCVWTSPESELVRFSLAGRSNPDVADTFTVAYPSGDRVRVVNADEPPDLEFRGALVGNEAGSVRRMDPRRLVEELARHPGWVVAERDDGWRDVRWPGSEAVAAVQVLDGRLRRVETVADLPLRGRVPVVWEWSWAEEIEEAAVELSADGQPFFRATGTRRTMTYDEAEALWRPSGGEAPREIPGQAWPATVDMRVETLGPGVHIVRGVRTGFHHLVVETDEGLVVADAPAGWVEFHQVPPRDLVQGRGISGLSERFVDFLGSQWPGMPVRAVAITHAHDDHAGGARAFAAAGAEVFAPAAVADFLEEALNRGTMPVDRLSMTSRSVRVRPVAERIVLDDPERSVELISIGANPHVSVALGVSVPSARVFFQSDLHVPGSDAVEPRTDRLESECWFAEWATRRLPPETVVHNSHGAVALEVGRLAGYLAQPACQG